VIAGRIDKINVSHTMKISAEAKKLAREGAQIIDLSAGEPDFPTPDNIKNAAVNAIGSNFTHYTLNAGTIDLRKAVSDKLKRDHHLDYDINEIIISAGAKQSIYNAVHTLVDYNDEVLIPSPYWVSYPEIVKLAHGNPIIINSSAKNNHKLLPEQISSAVTPKTKVLILCNPSNPTGMVYSEDELKPIAELCRRHNLFVISDEIYDKIIYDGINYKSFASLDDMRERTILINGVSKAYAMTGWRIGYAAGPEQVIKGMDKIQSHSTSNASSVSQAAALEAITGTQDYIKEMRSEFERRRDFLYKEINSIRGFSCLKPQGAFYLFPDVTSLFGLKTDVIKIRDLLIWQCTSFMRQVLQWCREFPSVQRDT
jgi:aspartate aminotransferase